MKFTANQTIEIDLNPDNTEPAVKVIADLKAKFPDYHFQRVLDGLFALLLLRALETSKPGFLGELLAGLESITPTPAQR